MPSKISSRILLVGGGHSHVQFLKSWRMNPIEDVELVMVSDVVNTPYSGMLPSRLVGWYSDEDMHFNLANLCAQAGAAFIHDAAVALNAGIRQAALAASPALHFDVCSLNVGVAPVLPPGAAGNPRVIPVKPISHLLSQWASLLEEFEEEDDQPWFVVGGGAAGFEVAMALRMASCRSNRKCDIQILEAGPYILPGHSSQVRARALKILSAWGIKVRLRCAVEKVHVQIARLSHGIEETFARMLVTTGGAAPGWIKNTDLRLSEKGFVNVDRFLQAVPRVVFAAGDCANFADQPLNKSGVYAVRQGPVLIENIRAVISGAKKLRAYRPQKKAMALLISGERRALLSYGPLAAEGEWVWKWKDRIDRRFMERFGGEPMKNEMTSNTCGGCGGKAPASAVRSLLQSLASDPSARSIVPDRVEDVGYLGNMAVTVDGFRTFTDDLFLFGRVAVLHALNDLFACGVRPGGATVMATLRPAAEKIRSDQLLHLMKGVLAALGENGARLLNAHTAEGADTSLAITALGEGGKRWPKHGLADGQVLVLTKPLGTGALLQASMQGRLSEKAWLALRDSLLLSHGRWLEKNSVPVAAATDISGFGLVGHLSEMMGYRTSGSPPRTGIKIVLNHAAVQSLPEFEELELDGVAAYLTAQNRASYSHLVTADTNVHSSIYYDPQTNGPLLLAVAAANGERLVAELLESGFHCAKIVGRVEASA